MANLVLWGQPSHPIPPASDSSRGQGDGEIVGLKVASYNIGATNGFRGPTMREFKERLQKDMAHLSEARRLLEGSRLASLCVVCAGGMLCRYQGVRPTIDCCEIMLTFHIVYCC